MPQTQITPELYEFIVKIIEDKVRDIKVTREEFEKLTSAVKELAEAQKTYRRKNRNPNRANKRSS